MSVLVISLVWISVSRGQAWHLGSGAGAEGCQVLPQTQGWTQRLERSTSPLKSQSGFPLLGHLSCPSFRDRSFVFMSPGSSSECCPQKRPSGCEGRSVGLQPLAPVSGFSGFLPFLSAQTAVPLAAR